MTINALFWDIGGVLLTNGWDREQRADVISRFGLDAGDFTERHKLAVPELELGRLTLDDYLSQVVFYAPRDFSREDFRAAMEAESQPHADTLALARDLAFFAEHGYRARRIEAFDLFPMTHHVECVATFEPKGEAVTS